MDYFNRFELRQVNNRVNEYELIVFIDSFSSEFANELGSSQETKSNLFESCKKLIANQYPGLKITVVRVMVSGIICATFPLTTVMASAQYTKGQEEDGVQIVNSIHYKVQPGDTLWNLSKKYNTSIESLIRANQLSTDTLILNQQLIIPKAFHSVVSGDYLSTLAIKYNTTSEAIREANHLSTDKIMIGQVLIIPQNINNLVVSTHTDGMTKEQTISYTVQSGDTLFLIAKKFQTSVDEIKRDNNLTSDLLSVGQLLKITTKISGENPPMIDVPAGIPESYTVKAGDTLTGIAKQFGLSVNFLMINNQLANEAIQAGDVLNLKENFIKGDRNQIGTVKMLRQVQLFSKGENGTLKYVRTLPKGGVYTAYKIDYDLNLYNVGGNQWIKITPDIQFTRVGETPSKTNSVSYLTHTVVSGDTIWDLSVNYGIPQSELLKVNKLNINSQLKVGQRLKIPQYRIAIKAAASSRHGEHLDWWTEAQYVVPIGKTFKVIDFATGKSFMVKRTIGANHADCETVTVRDSEIAKGIWKGYSWTERAVIIEVDGRKIAASMSFMPHDIEYINNNGIRGHFDIHFKNSTRHKDGKIDYDHQRQVNIAAGVK